MGRIDGLREKARRVSEVGGGRMGLGSRVAWVGVLKQWGSSHSAGLLAMGGFIAVRSRSLENVRGVSCSKFIELGIFGFVDLGFKLLGDHLKLLKVLIYTDDLLFFFHVLYFGIRINNLNLCGDNGKVPLVYCVI